MVLLMTTFPPTLFVVDLGASSSPAHIEKGVASLMSIQGSPPRGSNGEILRPEIAVPSISSIASFFARLVQQRVL
jgi:hypothetical protein